MGIEFFFNKKKKKTRKSLFNVTYLTKKTKIREKKIREINLRKLRKS